MRISKAGIKFIPALIALCVCIIVLTSCTKKESNDQYGVYIGAEPEELTGRSLADIIVIDAQYFDKDDITKLKSSGHTVYTYINIGSIENFRDYYEEYEYLTLDTYENWEDEKWIDVSDPSWQDFISKKADELISKGVDGFFVDNCDVYYQYRTQEIFEGVSLILNELKEKNTYVLINGGDTFVREYLDRFGKLDNILDGVNQESVVTCIDWENDKFSVNEKDEREYFLEYLQIVMDDGKDAYVIEYTTDKGIEKEAVSLAGSKGYTVYVAHSLDLK